METNIKKDELKNKPKRRWKSENLPRVFTVRAEDDEYQKLKKMAEKTGWSLSRLLIEATLSHGVKSVEESQAEREILEQMIFEIRKVGINLNQITHVLNAAHRGKGEAPMQSELEVVIKEVESVLTKLRKKL